ncbi:MAG TPA: hypothetical protein VD905_21840 [Flavobacteriales bacterium]|nr:hypothetical protein [Flavobacteriales bacterium]
MKATNGFNTRVAAIAADGKTFAFRPSCTFQGDEVFTVEGEVAGSIGEAYGEQCFWPAETLQTVEQYLLAKKLAKAVGAVLCCAQRVSPAVESFIEQEQLIIKKIAARRAENEKKEMEQKLKEGKILVDNRGRIYPGRGNGWRFIPAN